MANYAKYSSGACVASKPQSFLSAGGNNPGCFLFSDMDDFGTQGESAATLRASNFR